jgi:hypothetical protein
MQKKICLCNLLKIQKYLFLERNMNDIKDSRNIKHDLEQIGDDLFASEEKS